MKGLIKMTELKIITNEDGLEYKIVGSKIIITGVNSDVINIEIPDEITWCEY